MCYPAGRCVHHRTFPATLEAVSRPRADPGCRAHDRGPLQPPRLPRCRQPLSRRGPITTLPARPPATFEAQRAAYDDAVNRQAAASDAARSAPSDPGRRLTHLKLQKAVDAFGGTVDGEGCSAERLGGSKGQSGGTIGLVADRESPRLSPRGPTTTPAGSPCSWSWRAAHRRAASAADRVPVHRRRPWGASERATSSTGGMRGGHPPP